MSLKNKSFQNHHFYSRFFLGLFGRFPKKRVKTDSTMSKGCNLKRDPEPLKLIQGDHLIFRKDGDNGIPADKILGTYEEIIRRTYLAEGHCSEEDIIKFCGYMESKLQGELQVKIFIVAYFSKDLFTKSPHVSCSAHKY